MYTTDYGDTVTTDNDTLALLAAANPVPELPAAESPERLRRLIEAEDHTEGGARLHTPAGNLIEAEGHTVGGARRRAAARRLMRPLAAVGAAMLAATVGLLLSNGASSPGLNIAAAAYAATSSGSGVLEARFVDRTFLAHGRVVTSHHREWIDATTGMRRERRTLSALIGRHPSEIYELASSPGWIEIWDSAAGEQNVVRRVRYSAEQKVVRRVRYSAAGERGGAPRPDGPRGGTTQTPTGVATYRRLYRERSIKLVGRERRDGRLLWKLEGDVGFALYSFHAKLVPIMAVVVLVDPRTYLPVVQRTVSLLPGHRRQVQAESELLGYRRLPGGAASEALLKLSTQHPRARVVSSPTTPGSQRSHYIRERTP